MELNEFYESSFLEELKIKLSNSHKKNLIITIEIYIPGNTYMSIEVYNIFGKRVDLIIDSEYFTKGKYKIVVNFNNKEKNRFQDGTYFCSVITNFGVKTIFL